MSIRVLQLIPRLDAEAGGPPVAAVATALALQERGARNAFAFPIDGRHPGSIGDLVAILRGRGIPVHTFRESRFGDKTKRWGVSPRLALWLIRRSRGFDVVHVHMAWSFTAVAGLLTAKLRGSVAVLTPHESLADFDRLKSGAVKKLVKRALRAAYVRLFDLIVVASPLERQSIGTAGQRRSIVIAHAVDPVTPPPSPSSDDRFRVGFLARLDPKKNLELLIRALELLPDHVTLHVAGDGPAEYRDSLTALAAACGVEKRVQWHGFVDGAAKSAFLGSIDVLAMPSAFEGFGVAAAEALTAGIPVVVSDRVGIADVVARYACGRVVERTPAEVARGIRELDAPQARLAASENARRAAAQEFSRAAHGERLIEAYKTALEDGRGRRQRLEVRPGSRRSR